ncbi:MAG TPA: carboxypeptidase regulatory-like domain-containing protein [Terriglobales bacterium]|nr:carboxypeptidase regulatory-like domain-containing protein [Terriglobales bacterium]
MSSSLRWMVVLLAMAGLCASAGFAQETSSVTGTVTDATGAAVPNAQVTVSVPERGIVHTTPTNESGDFLVGGLPAGPVDVSVAASGFKKFQAKGVILAVAQKARVDVTLQVGAQQEEVTVEGTNVAQVETQQSDLSGTVTGKEITQLQLNGRNFTQLVTLVPGVSNQTGQDEGQVGIGGNVSFSVNGGRVEYNNWELDGGDNMDNGSNDTLNVYPSLESIAEFKVLTSNYGAQYGRNGSGTVEVETKSGTNQFHGNVYEFVRNDAFNARNYFESDVPPYKKNDFGYTIGGPIWKNKTFFFWSQEWRRDRVPNDFNQQVPSAAERSGDFTDQCPGDFCPVVDGVVTPNLNTVPGFDASDPNVQALLTLIPQPTTGSGAASFFQTTVSQPTNWREELIRVDHNLNDKNRLTFRYIHDTWQTTETTPLWTNQGSFPTIGTDFKGPGVSIVARANSTFSPTLLNEFVFSYTTDHIVLNDTGNWQRPSSMTIGDLFGGNGDGIIPGFQLVGDAYGGGFGQDPGYIPNGPYNSNPTYTYRDNVSKILGKHNLQFGAYFVFGQKNELGGELAAGSIPGYLTFDASNDPGNFSTGNPFADLLLGRITSFGQQDQRIKYYNRYKIVEPYFQDDWHVTSKLTLNLGLRVSLFGTYREKQKQAYNFDPAKYQAGMTTVDPDSGEVTGLFINGLPNGIVQCGVTPGVPVSCMQGHLFNPAPRIGFAWDPRGNGKTAIRGGYGIFFEHANGNEGNTESLENSPPLATTVQQNNIEGPNGTSGYAFVGTSAGAPAGQFPLSVVSVPTKATWPYIQQWHLDIQHEVLPNTVATVSYVGSKGTHLNRQSNLNQLLPVPLADNPYKPGEAIGPDDCTTMTTPSGVPITGQAAIDLGVAACGANPDAFRPYPGYSDIAHLEWKSSSIYHALQASVRHNVGSLVLSAAYTYSHSIDDSSDRFDASFLDSYDPASNRGSSNFDERHVFNLSWDWNIPFFKQPGLVNKVLGGWEYSGIAGISTGTPFSVIVSTDNAGVGNGLGSAAHPDLVGDPKSGVVQSPLDSFGPLFYNPAAFADPRGLTFGTAGRNILSNPRRTNFDMSLFKNFAINERMGFEFRAEAFNVFNHTEWQGIAGDAGSATNNVGIANNTFDLDPSSGFLRVSAAHNPRILQLALKFHF